MRLICGLLVLLVTFLKSIRANQDCSVNFLDVPQKAPILLHWISTVNFELVVPVGGEIRLSHGKSFVATCANSKSKY